MVPARCLVPVAAVGLIKCMVQIEMGSCYLTSLAHLVINVRLSKNLCLNVDC